MGAMKNRELCRALVKASPCFAGFHRPKTSATPIGPIW